MMHPHTLVLFLKREFRALAAILGLIGFLALCSLANTNLKPSWHSASIQRLGVEEPPLPVEMPFLFQDQSGSRNYTLRFKAKLDWNTFIGSKALIKADDCIISMKINGNFLIPPNNSKEFGTENCNHIHGFEKDLKNLLVIGENSIEIEIQNLFYDFGISITFKPEISNYIILSIITISGFFLWIKSLGLFIRNREGDRVWIWMQGVIYLRFIYPFYFSPLDNLFSDPGRHYENGKQLFDPTIMGSFDPKLYQLWVYAVDAILPDSRFVMNFFTGVLCALVPYVWYKFLREITTKNLARTGFFIIGLMPTFILIYAFFMNETLLLPLLGLSLWLTARALKKQTTAAFSWATFAWVCALFTRMIALPLTGIFIGLMLLKMKHKLKHVLIAAAIFTMFVVPASLHSMMMLQYVAPFGASEMNKIYKRSGEKTFELATENPNAVYRFSSPSFYDGNILRPFGEWWTARKDGIYPMKIDLAKGREDWLALIKTTPPGMSFYEQVEENFMYFFFDKSWPDSNGSAQEILPKLNWWNKYIWLPLSIMLLVLYSSWRSKQSVSLSMKNLTILSTLLLIALMIFQMSAVMEGRYRKPIELLIITSLLVVLDKTERKKLNHRKHRT